MKRGETKQPEPIQFKISLTQIIEHSFIYGSKIIIIIICSCRPLCGLKWILLSHLIHRRPFGMIHSPSSRRLTLDRRRTADWWWEQCPAEDVLEVHSITSGPSSADESGTPVTASTVETVMWQHLVYTKWLWRDYIR